jgi:hypothetical protein
LSRDLDVVRQYIDAINRHDSAAIVALASPDHRFIDSLGEELPAGPLLSAWEAYFRMVPDYRIEVIEWAESDTSVLAVGKASGTFTSDGTLHQQNAWSIPAAWRAVVTGGKVAEWQVYADNEPVRRLMRARG